MPHTPQDFLDEARRAIPAGSVEAVAARRTYGDAEYAELRAPVWSASRLEPTGRWQR